MISLLHHKIKTNNAPTYTAVGATQLAFDKCHLKHMDILGGLKVGLLAEVMPTRGRGNQYTGHKFLFFSVVSLFVDLQINQVTQQLKVSISDLV
jgi:hypothetical protein